MVAIDDESLVSLSDFQRQPQYDTPEPPPRKASPVRHAVTKQANPRDVRGFRIWLMKMYVFGPVALARRWVMAWSLKVDEFVWTVRGPRLSREEYEARNAICGSCAQRDGEYCKPCGCGTWSPAKLKNKNWYERWNCPHGKHPGSFVDAKVKPTPTTETKCKGNCNGKN